MLDSYFTYRRVIARFRRSALGNEIDHIAADLSRMGYKPDSAKLYLARIARFSAYATGCGCSKSKPIPAHIVDRYLRTRPTEIARWAAHGAISFAARSSPKRFAVEPSQKDSGHPLIEDYLQHLRVTRGLRQRTCEGLVLTARRMMAWQKQNRRVPPASMREFVCV